MNKGYAKFWRKSLDAGWIKNHKTWAFWSYCLLKASYKEFDAIVGFQRVRLMPGQFIFGLRKASEETGLTIQEIRTVLNFLKKAGNLTVKTTNKYSVISIINWVIYQCDEFGNNTQNNKPLTNHQQRTRSKEYKKEEGGRKSPTPTPDDFPVTDKMKAYAKQKKFTGNIDTLTEKFLNYHRAKGSRFRDWDAAFRNWILKEIEFHPAGPSATDQPLNGGRILDEVLS